MSNSIGVDPSPAEAVGAVGGLTIGLGGKRAGWLKGLGFGGAYAGVVLGYCVLVVGRRKVGFRAAIVVGSQRVEPGTEEAASRLSR